jgi:probable HAF family extracellular repeat protein
MKMKMTTILISTLAALLYISVASPCDAAAPNPTPTALGVLPGFDSSEARGINASGQVVGFCSNGKAQQPFIWQNGVMTKLPIPDGYNQGWAESINTSGVIVGYCGELNGVVEACLWQLVNNTWEVKLLGWPSPYSVSLDGDIRHYDFKGSCGSKINDAGQVLAFTFCIEQIEGEASVNSHMVGCIWQKDRWTVLGIAGEDAAMKPVVYPLALFHPPVDMNQKGQILLHAIGNDEESADLWLWQNGMGATRIVDNISCAGLNNSGQIVGSLWNIIENQRYNFTYSIDTDSLTQTPSVDDSMFRRINDNGQVLVARCYQYGNDMHNDLGIVIWPALGPVTPIGTVPLNFQDNLYFNNAGEVCGSDGLALAAFYASVSTEAIPLQGLVTAPAIASARINGMSSSGMIVGVCGTADGKSHAVLWSENRPVQSKAPVTLGALPGDDFSQVRDVNASGQVVGVSISEGDNWDFHPFIWDNGVMTPLPLPDGCQEGEVTSINALGQIVGCYEISGETTKFQACRWTFSGTEWQMTVLETPEGYESSVALKISDAGQILAHGTKSDGSYVAGLWDGNSWTVLKNGETPLIPLQMNEKGQVLANDQFGGGKLFVWANGTATELASSAQYYSMNNLGQVVWAFFDDESRRDISGVYLPEAAYGLAAGIHMVPGVTYRAINNAGLVLITKPLFEDTDGDGYYETLVKTELKAAYLDGSPGFTCSIPGAEVAEQNTVFLDAKGEVGGLLTMRDSQSRVGFHISTTGLLQLDSLPQDTDLKVIAMNDSGRVIGHTAQHAVLWDTSTPHQNQPPAANAGADLAVAATGASTAVMLDGSGSSDPDADSLTYTWTENGTEIATGANPSLTLSPGTHTITLTVADPEVLTSMDTVTVSVTYSWSGVLQPIDPPNASGVSASVFKAGSTVPVKFALTGASAGITSLAATLSYAKVSNGIAGTDIEAVSIAAATAGNLFRYDTATRQYIFNWSTKRLAPGTYRLTIDLGDGVSHAVDIGLR